MVSFRQILIFGFLISFSIFSSCDLREYRTLEQEDSYRENIRKSDDSIDNNRSLSSSSKTQDSAQITHTAKFRTSLGNFTIGLFGEDVPETIANFIGLIKLNYYNGVLFHRVAKDFLIQAGDRNTIYQEKKAEWGFGGESFYGGDIEDEINPNTASYKIGYQAGTVAMANKGQNTNTSQFFICLEDASKLKHNWTIFGKVISGMNVVEKISNVPVEPSERGVNDGIPIKPVRIHSVSLNLIHAPNYN